MEKRHYLIRALSLYNTKSRLQISFKKFINTFKSDASFKLFLGGVVFNVLGRLPLDLRGVIFNADSDLLGVESLW